MATITLIDDEHAPMDLYVRALRQSGFEIQHLDSVELALKHIREAEVPSDLYIIDLMMPPGTALDLEAAGFGLKSGIIVHRQLRQRFPSVPVIVLTSVSNPSILEAIPFDEHTKREAKIDVLPFQLVTKVREILQSTKHE